jgi:hypothetical protein
LREVQINFRWPLLGFRSTINKSTISDGLLQAEALAHDALQAGFVEEIEGEFLVGEHGESGALSAGGQFGGFLRVRLGSWPITDMTMLIINCRRRILRASSSRARRASSSDSGTPASCPVC